MSIFLIKKELKEVLEKLLEKDYSIDLDYFQPIAKLKKPIYFSDYSEKKLQEIAEKKGKITLEFWNFEYCSKENIFLEELDSVIQTLDYRVKDKLNYVEGLVTTLILIHQLLLNVYKINDRQDFQNYLESFKVPKKMIKNFLVNTDLKLPLTLNYLTLLKKVFDKDEILDFIFKEEESLNLNNFERLISHFKIEKIHQCAFLIFKFIKHNKERLEYIDVSLDYFHEMIGNITEEKIIFNKNNYDPHIGFFLISMPVDQEWRDLYYKVIKKYIDKGGQTNIEVLKDEKATLKLRERCLEIQEYFHQY